MQHCSCLDEDSMATFPDLLRLANGQEYISHLLGILLRPVLFCPTHHVVSISIMIENKSYVSFRRQRLVELAISAIRQRTGKIVLTSVEICAGAGSQALGLEQTGFQ